MSSVTERRFHADMVAGAERLKREVGYNPTRFMQMVGELGGVEAARHLLRGRDASDGFTTLWERGRLEVSVEAFALLPWYRELFTEAELATAERRLVEHLFDVQRLLREAEGQRPAWTSGTVGPAPHQARSYEGMTSTSEQARANRDGDR